MAVWPDHSLSDSAKAGRWGGGPSVHELFPNLGRRASTHASSPKPPVSRKENGIWA